MLQPFLPFKPEYIQRLRGLKKNYIVSQSYHRANSRGEAEHKIGLLFTDYGDPGLGKTHLNAVKHDRYAYMLDLNNEKHISKIKEMLAGSVYQIYWSVIPDADEFRKTINMKYADHVRRFVLANTNWNIGGQEVLKPNIQVIFGELFMILKRGSQTLRRKFEEIENA
jgi:hypothetical protein